MTRILKKSPIQGMSLIETIVAVTILAAAIVGPMTLAAQSLKASRYARSELIATHLAEEGVEVIHNIRDNNITNYPTGSWLANIFSSTTPACNASCAIDVTQGDATLVWATTAIIPCVPNCLVLGQVYYNPKTGLYKQSATPPVSPWVATQFSRAVTVEGIDDPINPLRQARVTVVVSYPGYGSIPRNITIVDDIYNWFPPLH